MDCCVCFTEVPEKKHFKCGHWVCNDCFSLCRSPVPKKLRCPMCRAEEYFICNSICNSNIDNLIVCIIVVVIIIIALKDIRLLMHACSMMVYFVVVR